MGFLFVYNSFSLMILYLWETWCYIITNFCWYSQTFYKTLWIHAACLELTIPILSVGFTLTLMTLESCLGMPFPKVFILVPSLLSHSLILHLRQFSLSSIPAVRVCLAAFKPPSGRLFSLIPHRHRPAYIRETLRNSSTLSK